MTPVTRGDRLQLGPRGRRLFDELHALGKPSPADLVLIEEACRIADRLDRLDAVLRGDAAEWVRVKLPDDDGDLVLIVNGAMVESRQQATALKQICAELRQSAGVRKSAPAAGGEPKSGSAEQPAQQEGGILDQLGARRAKRLADAAGS